MVDGETEPEPVLRWADLVGVVGWSTVLVGFLLLLISCGGISLRACSSSHVLDSIYAEIGGGLILAVRQFVKAKRKKTLLKQTALTLITIVAAVLAILLVLYLQIPVS